MKNQGILHTYLRFMYEFKLDKVECTIDKLPWPCQLNQNKLR